MSARLFLEHPVCRALASAGSVGGVLLDAVRRESARRAGVHDGDQLRLPLERSEEDGEEAPRVLRAEDLAAAALLGAVFETEREVLAALQSPETVCIIDVGEGDLVAPVLRVIRRHILPDAPLPPGSKEERARPGSVAFFHDPTAEPRFRSTDDEPKVVRAVQQGCALLGVSADPERHLPRELLQLAENTLHLPRFDSDLLCRIVEAATAQRPAPIPAENAAATTVRMIALAVRPGLSAERCRARLLRLAKPPKKERQEPKLSELAGLGDAKEFGMQLVADIRAALDGRLDWGTLPKGCLLTSEPGMGKTTYARALAAEAGVNFVATSVAKWMSKREGHLGDVTREMRGVFADAQRKAPSIIFIDEIDTLPTRHSTTSDNGWWNACVNALLECIDGFDRRPDVFVFVLAACNDASALDPALVRSARLDRCISIPRPDVAGLAGIFRTHLRHELPDADLVRIAAAASGRSGADVERFVRDARAHARHSGTPLTEELLVQAVRDGAPSHSEALKRAISYHEAGHAVVAVALELAVPLSMTINSAGGLIENVVSGNAEENRAHFEGMIAAVLAGRAAQELVFGKAAVTAGAGGMRPDNDLSRASAIATRLESAYGLGRSGLMWMPADNPRDLALFPHLLAAVRETLERAYARATEVLQANRPALDALATALYEREHLDDGAIRAVLQQCPVRKPPPEAKHDESEFTAGTPGRLRMSGP